MDEFREICWRAPRRTVRVLKEECLPKKKKNAIVRHDEFQDLVETALRKLGVCETNSKRRKIVAVEVAHLLEKSEISPQSAKYQRLVDYFRKIRFELGLLKLLQERVGDGSEYHRLRQELEEKDTFYEGYVTKTKFFQALDSLNLGLDETQKDAIARPFLRSTLSMESPCISTPVKEGKEEQEEEPRIRYQTFLTVIDPQHSESAHSTKESDLSSSSSSSPRSAFGEEKSDGFQSPFTVKTNSSSSDGSSSTSTSTSSSGSSIATQDLLILRKDGILGTLDMLRQRILKAQANGVSIRESFSHFDKDQDGYLSQEEFMEGLGRLDIHLTFAKVKMVFQAFHGHDDDQLETIDYMQFLRFIDEDYDSLGYFTREGIDFPDEPEPIPFHDFTKSGPFVAGYSETGRSRQTKEVRKAEEKMEEGAFVRHSYTSAGYVRQVIHKKATKKKETHQMIPHAKKGKKVRYTGTLETNDVKKKADIEEKRRLANATKTNSIVKYLGYAAEICNDYPRKEFQSKSSVNTVLVRNFKKKSKKKFKTSSTMETNTLSNTAKDEGIDPSTISSKLFHLRKEFHRLRDCHRLEFLSTGSKANRFASKLVECQKKIVELTLSVAKGDFPNLLMSLAQRQDDGEPGGRLALYEMINLAAMYMLNEDWAKVKIEIDNVLNHLRKLHNPKASSKKSKKVDTNRRRRRISAEEEDDLFEFLDLRKAFASAMVEDEDQEENRNTVKIDVLSRKISELCFFGDPDCPMKKLKEHLGNSDGESYFRHALGDNVKRVSWKDVLEAFRQEENETYWEFLRQVEDYFTGAELASLRSAFTKARNRSETSSVLNFSGSPIDSLEHVCSGENLLKGIEFSKLLHARIFDQTVLEEELSEHPYYSWEEFLVIMRKSVTDFEYQELLVLAHQVVGESCLLQACRNKTRINKTMLKDASANLNLSLDERLDFVNHDEWDPSLFEIYDLVAEMRKVEAELEEVTTKKKVEELVERYLASRSGTHAMETIVDNMLSSEKLRDRNSASAASREKAELSARQMLRKKKTRELMREDMISVVKMKREEAVHFAEKAQNITETCFGHQSMLSTIGSFRLYQLLSQLGRSNQSMEHLTVVLHNLRDSQPRFSVTIGRVAKLLAMAEQKEGNMRDAAQHFQLAAECYDHNDDDCDDGQALDMWKEAIACLEAQVDDDRLAELQLATHRVVQILEHTKPGSNDLIQAYLEYGNVLVKAGDLDQAKKSYRSAKTIIVRKDPVLTPARRKQVCRINRLIANADSNAALMKLGREVNNTEMDDEEKIDMNASFLL